MILNKERYGYRRIAEYCGVQPYTVKNWIKKGKIKSIEGDEDSVSPEELMNFLDSYPKYKKRVEDAYEQFIQKKQKSLMSRLEHLEEERKNTLERLKRLDSYEMDFYF